MNRFYKPTPREYVSTHVDMPWEFLQGVAEQKQKGFDAANAGADATASLLNFNVIPGDTEYKQEKQKQYNEKLYKVRDYLMQTGDYSGASRDLANVTREINQDQDLAIMKAAVAPYEKDRDAFEKMKQEGKLLNQWQSNFRTDYSTRDDKTGRHKSYNQLVGYESPDYHKAATDSFGKLELSVDEKGRTYFVDGLGIKRDVTQSGGAILQQDIINRAETALPAYRNTNAYYDHKVRAAWELNNNLNPDLKKIAEEKGDYQAIMTRADELSRQNMISTNLDQIKHQSKDIIKDDLYSKDDRAARGLPDPSNPPTQPLDDTSMEMKGKTFDLGRTTKQYKEAIPNSTKDRLVYKTQKPADIFNKEEYSQYKQFMNTTNPQLHLKMFQGKASDEEIQGTYQKFKEYYDAVHLGINANTKVRMINGTPELHGLLTSQKKADINLYDLEHGGGIGSAAPVLNATTGEWTTMGALNEKLTGSDGKNVKITLNKEILPYNGIVLNAKENEIPEPDRFATGYGFTVEKTGEQYIFAKPKEMLTLDEKNINKMHTNTWIPGEPEELNVPTSDGRSKKAFVVFDPNMSMAEYSAKRQKGEPVGGVIIAYKTKEAADKKSTNPDDMLFTPTTDTQDDRYMYQSDPENAYLNIRRRFEKDLQKKREEEAKAIKK